MCLVLAWYITGDFFSVQPSTFQDILNSNVKGINMVHIFDFLIWFFFLWHETLFHCEKNVFIEKNHLSWISYLASEIFIKTINTKYMTIPTIVSPVKMEYGWNFSISRLKMTLKSGFDFFLNSSMSSPCHFNYCTLCFWSKFLLSMR